MRRAARIGWLLAAAAGLRAEVIDRVVAAVGVEMIARSDVEREARLEAFFGGADPSKTLERLIQQRLIRQEMDQISYPEAEETDVKRWLGERRPGGAVAVPAGLGEQDLVEYARRFVRIERFIDLRFAAGLQIPVEDIEKRYQETFLAEWKKQNAGEAPGLEAVRDRIREDLREQRVSRALDAWMAELRSRVAVRVMETEAP